MKHRRATAWWWFAVTAVPLLAVLAWLTTLLVSLDNDELEARQQARLHERLRLALWRMDSWLSPQLGREAVRAPTEFQSFAAPDNAWSRGFTKLAPEDVLVPSPLLGMESPIFALHFEMWADGSLHSPQVPTGNQRDVCDQNGIDAGVLTRASERLERLRSHVQLAVLDARIGGAERLQPSVGCNVAPPGAGQQAAQSVAEYNNRQVTNLQGNQNPGLWRATANGLQPTSTTVGPMVPLWLDIDAEPMLLVARRVHDRSGGRLQGIVLDWPALQRELLQLTGDLFAVGTARLVRCEQPSATEQGAMLATVPARLEADHRDASLCGTLPVGAILAVTWGVALLGLGVLAFTLRAAIGFGERRARFASAVTHELRTPLTTFRMYSEMLADGVVADPEAKQEYLRTLQRESDRLSRVVENVLAWSRLEEGRFAARRERHGVRSLVDRITPVLQRRLGEAGMTLAIRVVARAADAVVTTDEDAVGQILFNLVDNAAKYGRRGDGGAVELVVDAVDDGVTFAVRDHGPGVPAAHRRAIWAPFDRGAVPVSSNDQPGTGLGLPLARGLARDLGGDLVLDDSVTDGACFVLRLPTR